MAVAQFGPMGSLLTALAGWVWSTLDQALFGLLDAVVFHPLTWPPLAGQIFAASRNLALALMAAAVAWALLTGMWPGGFRYSAWVPAPALERVVVGAVWVAVWQPAVTALLTLNNALVAALVASPPTLVGAFSPAGALLSPLLGLGLALLVVVLAGYLAVFYALRTVEILVLLGLGPLVAVAWTAAGHDAWLANYWREMLVAIFVQTAHAMAFWLFARLLAEQPGSLGGAFLAAGALWYMAALPGQLRRLVGAAPSGGRRLWWR